MMRKHEHNMTAEVVSFSAGALIGAGLALLYAPKKGDELREQLGNATEESIAKMKDLTADVQQKINRNLRRGKEYAEEKASELSSTAEDVKEQFH